MIDDVMKKLDKPHALTLSLLANQSCSGERMEQDLSNRDWKLWLDKEAEFWNDKLHLPPVDLTQVEVQKPTCGWDQLYSLGKCIHLPATVEEYHWGDQGNDYGVSGNFVGVSWFSTKLFVPEYLNGKRVFLHFESVRLRAEVYLNRKLVGYDLINGTPFDVDISDAAEYGALNELSVRITNPNGNFNWRDYVAYEWGNYMTPPSHGFGGITGRVFLRATETSRITDVFIKNTPRLNEVDVEVALESSQGGVLLLELYEGLESSTPLARNTVPLSVADIAEPVSLVVALKNAKLWSPNSPNLYFMKVSWSNSEGTVDSVWKRFGFRWFEIRDVAGARQFYLNGQRIVLRTSISWGFWPINGVYPTREFAEKQIRMAKELGLNMLNFHRGIGQTEVLELADEIGLLYYEEPGGYVLRKEGVQVEWLYDAFTRAWLREKIFRMIKRDRSHPSLIIYNLQNEANRDPDEWNEQDMKDAHALDETRVLTYSSHFFPDLPEVKYYDGKCPKVPAKAKMFMEPYDHDLKIQGWWDEHHASGPGVYRDEFYRSPTDYYLYTNHASEIVFYGEDGAIGTPARVQLIKQDLERSERLGWDGQHYIDQFYAYEEFLKRKGFSGAFNSVDALTVSLGNVALYYQGRIIENTRINNLVDGYVVNGWESFKLENHSGVVDTWRNCKGDKELLSYYNRPVYIAIKARDKVIATGQEALIDFHIVNEKGYHGEFLMEAQVLQNGQLVAQFSEIVNLSGGHTYGELLKQGVSVEIRSAGYANVVAKLSREGKVIATGNEELFAVELKDEIQERVEVLDGSGRLKGLCAAVGFKNVVDKENTGHLPVGNLLFASDIPKSEHIYGTVHMPIIEWVKRGNKVVVIKNTTAWARFLKEREVVDFRGEERIGIWWYGGNYFVREHPLFDGLPVNTAFNWEYQCLAHYDCDRYALRMEGEECVVGAQLDHKRELFTSVALIPVGSGHILLSTLDLEGAIAGGGKPAVVAKKILQNFLLY